MKNNSIFNSVGLAISCVILVSLTAPLGCAHNNFISGTKIEDTAENKEVLMIIERYRAKMVSRDVDGVLLLASKNYFEDAGTPRADDDYGYDGLREILAKRLNRVQSIRYQIQYQTIKTEGSIAKVQTFINGAFELASETGDRYRRKADYHEFTLEKDSKGSWKFIGGM